LIERIALAMRSLSTYQQSFPQFFQRDHAKDLTRMMDVTTLLVLLAIAAIATIVSRTLAGYSLSGCLTTYVVACLGAVGGWVLQQQLFGPDSMISVPFGGVQRPVSVIGASIGALLLAFIASLLGRPTAPRRRRR
jgi:uncharacterized membrane protein YeaQ/YmgE (transglycosylase-associated protein family)